MEEIKNSLNIFFNKTNRSYSKNELKKEFKIKGEEQTYLFEGALNALTEDGSLFFYGNEYKSFQNITNFIYGKLNSLNKNGGTVITNKGTIHIDLCFLNGALINDSVIVSNMTENKKGILKGKIYEIIKRGNEKTIFEVIRTSNGIGLKPINNNSNIKINLKPSDQKKLIAGSFIKIKIGNKQTNGEYLGEIDEFIGYKNDPEIISKIVLELNDIPTSFSEKAMEEAQKLPTKVTNKDKANRKDLRGKDFITIDCDNTKDMDDAVFVEKLPNGNYNIYVAIAHVSHYIKENSQLHKEAQKRCFSNYICDSCNPMIPPIISNGICSLNEKEDRLVRCYEIEINNQGEIIDYNFYKGIINSRKKMKYSEVNQVLEGNVIDGYQPYQNILKTALEISKILDQVRINRHCIDFDTLEINTTFDKENNSFTFNTKKNGTAGRIIENLMLLTDKVTFQSLDNYKITFPCRNHEEPDAEKLFKILQIIKNTNVNISIPKKITPKYLQTVCEQLIKIDNEKNGKRTLVTLLLTATKRANYSIKNLGHFGLQEDGHCHITSPIRRIIDLEIQYIQDKMEEGTYFNKELYNEIDRLSDLCNYASIMERKSDKAEILGLKMAMANEISKNPNSTFEAVITDINEKEIKIIANDVILGCIHLNDFIDDKYIIDMKYKKLFGRSNKKSLHIGDQIQVKLKYIDYMTGTIYFKGNGNFKGIKKENDKSKQKSLRLN